MNKCIIIDIDETLLHTFSDIQKFNNFTPKYGEEKFERVMLKDSGIQQHRYFGVLRPNVYSFLAWISGNFKNIGVWSAGKRQYVECMVEMLFRGRKPNFIWSWDECDAFLDREGTFKYYKPLEFVFNTYPEFTPKNTIFIDDLLHSDICNAGNMLTIKPFNPEEYPQEPDSSLLDIKKFLKGLKDQTDIRLVEKVLK